MASTSQQVFDCIDLRREIFSYIYPTQIRSGALLDCYCENDCLGPHVNEEVFHCSREFVIFVKVSKTLGNNTLYTTLVFLRKNQTMAKSNLGLDLGVYTYHIQKNDRRFHFKYMRQVRKDDIINANYTKYLDLYE